MSLPLLLESENRDTAPGPRPQVEVLCAGHQPAIQSRRDDSIKPGARAPGNGSTTALLSPERAAAGSHLDGLLSPLRGSGVCLGSRSLGLCRPFGPVDLGLPDMSSTLELQALLWGAR